MKMKTYLYTVLLSLYLCLTNGFFSATGAGQVGDHSTYAKLLETHVSDGLVDYAGFKSEEADLDHYLRILEKTEVKKLTWEGQLAFYINAYNAWTIKLILTKYPDIKTIRELGFLDSGPWKKKVVRLKDELVSLDTIEHDILRPRFKDPRVHFAINCASKSCPPLRPEPFRGDILNQQLDESTRSFLNDPDNYVFENTTFYISRIFKWFPEDFNNDPLEFYLKYAGQDLKTKLETNRNKIAIKYLDYDWGLNGK